MYLRENPYVLPLLFAPKPRSPLFTRTLAIEGRRNGIRANVVTPSMTTGTSHFDAVMADPFCARPFSKAEKMAGLGVVSKDELGVWAAEAKS